MMVARGEFVVVFVLLILSGSAADRSPIVIDRLELTIPSQPRVENDLTFGTYNVRGLSDRVNLKRDFDRMPQVNAWALQEVACPPQLDDVFPKGQWHIAYARVNGTEGQLIASRWPIVDAAVWELPSSGKRRIALAATLATPRGPVLFVNADHAPSFFSIDYQSRWQAENLAEILRKLPDEPIVVAGDFNSAGNLLRFAGNTSQNREINRAMNGSQLKPIDGNPPDVTFHSGLLKLRLDRMFVRRLECTQFQIEARAAGSDHYPTWCRVKPID